MRLFSAPLSAEEQALQDRFEQKLDQFERLKGQLRRLASCADGYAAGLQGMVAASAALAHEAHMAPVQERQFLQAFEFRLSRDTHVDRMSEVLGGLAAALHGKVSQLEQLGLLLEQREDALSALRRARSSRRAEASQAFRQRTHELEVAMDEYSSMLTDGRLVGREMEMLRSFHLQFFSQCASVAPPDWQGPGAGVRGTPWRMGGKTAAAAPAAAAAQPVRSSSRDEFGLRGKVADVLFDFEPTAEREIPLQRGTVIHVSKVKQSGWCLGRNHQGQKGYFPSSYVSLRQGTRAELKAAAAAKAEACARTAVVQHTFQASSGNQVSLVRGDTVTVLRVKPSGWCLGESRGAKGFFPASYVKMGDAMPVAAPVLRAASSSVEGAHTQAQQQQAALVRETAAARSQLPAKYVAMIKAGVGDDAVLQSLALDRVDPQIFFEYKRVHAATSAAASQALGGASTPSSSSSGPLRSSSSSGPLRSSSSSGPPPSSSSSGPPPPSSSSGPPPPSSSSRPPGWRPPPPPPRASTRADEGRQLLRSMLSGSEDSGPQEGSQPPPPRSALQEMQAGPSLRHVPEPEGSQAPQGARPRSFLQEMQAGPALRHVERAPKPERKSTPMNPLAAAISGFDASRLSHVQVAAGAARERRRRAPRGLMGSFMQAVQAHAPMGPASDLEDSSDEEGDSSDSGWDD